MIILERLQCYFDSNALLTASQFGFRKGFSTSSAVNVVIGAVLGALDGSQRLAIAGEQVQRPGRDTTSSDRVIGHTSGNCDRGPAFVSLGEIITGRVSCMADVCDIHGSQLKLRWGSG
ncbi:hypothetical protein J6590_013523 [Homalodisca vitripennis]|nr:hypothetical protein J6590_013523 [Homalodisca vitripennis]